jgi:NAD(P)-dependent dehydrogenase (short-subunit alcohol dehydrogenase family)
VTRPDELRALAAELRDIPLDVLYNNAGVYLEPTYQGPELGGIRYDDWMETFAVNTLGPVRVTETLVENLAAGEKRVVAVNTSHMGSIADIDTPGSYYYRSSKAALNAAMRGLGAALAPRGIGVLLLHPGGVETRMGPRGGISPEQSARGLRRLVDGYSPGDSGRFLRYDGRELPW